MDFDFLSRSTTVVKMEVDQIVFYPILIEVIVNEPATFKYKRKKKVQ